MAGEPSNLLALTTPGVALYILNQKRHFLNDMEARYGVTITVTGSDKVQGANFQIERGPQTVERAPARSKDSAIQMGAGHSDVPIEAEESEADEERAEDGEMSDREPAALADRPEGEDEEGDDEPRRRRRRRRRGRGDRFDREHRANGEHGNGDGREDVQAGSNVESINGDADEGDDDGEDEGAEDIVETGGGERRDTPQADDSDGDRNGRRGRRRGRRGGRRRRERGDRQDMHAAPRNPVSDPSSPQPHESSIAAWDTFEPTIGELAAAERQKREPERLGFVADAPTPPPIPTLDAPPVPVAIAEAPRQPEHRSESEERPVERSQVEAAAATREEAPARPEPVTEAVPPPIPEEAKPRRTGWWQKR